MANFEYLSSWFRHTLLTSTKERIARLQVDPGNTGFFDAREFRYFREFDIPNGESIWIRVTVVDDGIILRNQSITIGQGRVRFRAWRDVSLTGVTFAAPASPLSGLFQQNNLPSAPSWTPVTTIEDGGNHTTATGGTVSEVKLLRTSSATAQQVSVGATTTDERGIAPGVYYLQIENLAGSGSSQGVYDLKYEERIGQG